MPSEVDETDIVDYEALKKRIKDVLRRHYPTNDEGDANPEFDDCFTSEQALDEIYEIVGGI